MNFWIRRSLLTWAMPSKESGETACLESFQIKIINQSQPQFPITLHPKDNQADVSRARICVCSQIHMRSVFRSIQLFLLTRAWPGMIARKVKLPTEVKLPSLALWKTGCSEVMLKISASRRGSSPLILINNQPQDCTSDACFNFGNQTSLEPFLRCRWGVVRETVALIFICKPSFDGSKLQNYQRTARRSILVRFPFQEARLNTFPHCIQKCRSQWPSGKFLVAPHAHTGSVPLRDPSSSTLTPLYLLCSLTRVRRCP